VDHGAADNAIVQALQWLLTSQPGLNAMVADHKALSSVWAALARAATLRAQLHLLRVLTVLAGFWEGYPQIPRLFAGRFVELHRFLGGLDADTAAHGMRDIDADGDGFVDSAEQRTADAQRGWIMQGFQAKLVVSPNAAVV